MNELLQASGQAQAAAILAKKVSSEELIDACLSRIAATNPILNAVVQINEASARIEARQADAALAVGRIQGPLHGVPFTVKDWIETVGLICAAGDAERADVVPQRDATVVARIRAAGGILLGKSNVLEDNPVYGATRNPYDQTRTPGLSSSGEAAIIAAWGSPVGLGSDSGGSLRYPAHCCGIATLKPTSGRVPNTGHFPRISALNDPRTQIGPMARHVEDLGPMLRIIAGVDWRDASVVPVPLGDAAAVDRSTLRVAFFVDFGDATADPDTARAMANVVRALTDDGLALEEARPPQIEESLAITRDYWRRVRSVGWTNWAPDGSSLMTGEEVDRSLFEWDRFRRTMLPFIEAFDLIVCPVCEHPAGPHGESGERDFLYTLPFSLTGWPVAVVRIGTSEQGLPIGVQIVAKPWREDVALAIAARLEAALGGWQAPPSVRRSPRVIGGGAVSSV